MLYIVRRGVHNNAHARLLLDFNQYRFTFFSHNAIAHTYDSCYLSRGWATENFNQNAFRIDIWINIFHKILNLSLFIAILSPASFSLWFEN